MIEENGDFQNLVIAENQVLVEFEWAYLGDATNIYVMGLAQGKRLLQPQHVAWSALNKDVSLERSIFVRKAVTGGGKPDNLVQVFIDLEGLPESVHQILFVLSSNQDTVSLDPINEIRGRISDPSTGTTTGAMTWGQVGPYRSVELFSLRRTPWRVDVHERHMSEKISDLASNYLNR